MDYIFNSGNDYFTGALQLLEVEIAMQQIDRWFQIIFQHTAGNIVI